MSSSKANSTSFKSIERFEHSCPECNSTFLKRAKERKVYCSVKCSNNVIRRKRFISQSKEDKCLELAKQGKTIAEISETTGFPQGSVASYLNKAKFRKRKQGISYQAQLNKLKKIYKKCHICKFDRIVEVCHIIPASKGGDLTEENTIGLCPNHHHLFDNKKLTESEAELLKDVVKNYKEYIKYTKITKTNSIYSVDVETGDVQFFEKRKDIKDAGFDPSTVDKQLKGLFKKAYNKLWFKCKVFKPENLND